MASIQGVVISVSTETDVKKQGGGTYRGWELVYKTPEGEVRTVAKPVQGLRFNQALKNVLSELKAGDEFTLIQEKNAQGFNDVKSIVKGFVEVEHTPSAPRETQTKAPAANNSYVARDFETKEERALKQRLIVRQSSVAQAVAILSVGAKSVNVDDVKKLAEDLTAFVYEKKVDRGSVEDLEDDIPY